MLLEVKKDGKGNSLQVPKARAMVNRRQVSSMRREVLTSNLAEIETNLRENFKTVQTLG